MENIREIFNDYGLKWLRGDAFGYAEFRKAVLRKLRKVGKANFEQDGWEDFEDEIIEMLFSHLNKYLCINDFAKFAKKSGLAEKVYAKNIPNPYKDCFLIVWDVEKRRMEMKVLRKNTLGEFISNDSEKMKKELRYYKSLMSDQEKMQFLFGNKPKTADYLQAILENAVVMETDVAKSGVMENLTKELVEELREWSKNKVEAYLKRRKITK